MLHYVAIGPLSSSGTRPESRPGGLWGPARALSGAGRFRAEEGDLRPDQVKLIAKRLGVTEQDVVDMNRRLGGDASLNAAIRDDGDSGE